ncbi:MAG: MucBP domain-containing protein [Clostridiales bacterium]|nr:MucBP domain-containing protein [Candidatus Crickella merdequi]
MNKNVRKSLALFIAGIMIVTGLAFTSDNILKAADPNAAVTEQTNEGAEGAADNAVTENPEVKDETASINDNAGNTGGEAQAPVVESGSSGSITRETRYTVGVGETVTIQSTSGGKTSKWTSLLPYYATVDYSNGVVTGRHESGIVPVTIVREYKIGNKTRTEEFLVWVVSASKATLTINYVDEDGNQLFSSYQQEYDKGSTYNVPSPDKEGYTVDRDTVSGTINEDTVITVTYTENKSPRYNCYVYGLIPGKSADSSERVDDKWEGLGVVEIYNVPEPTVAGVRQSEYAFGKTIKTLYPNLTYDGKVYRYAAPGSAEANMEGYYTLSIMKVTTSDGANSGHNGYNPYVNTGTVTYHADYMISLVTKTTVFVNFAVAEPESSVFEPLEKYAQQVDKNTAESSLKKPAAADVPETKTVNGTTYYFDGWYKDSGCTQKADFNGNLTGNQTYYGRYLAYPTAEIKYMPGDHGTFEPQIYEAQINTATPEFRGEPVGEAGYEFDGWTPAVASKVTGEATYTATWRAKSDTPYKVEFFYEKNGAYSDTPDFIDENRAGTTAETVRIKEEDKNPDSSKEGYIFDSSAAGNVLSAELKGDGTTVLKVYFKEQFTVTFKPGAQGTFSVSEHAGLAYGTATPEAPDAANNHKAGYTFGGWTPALEGTVTKNATYVAQWVADDKTPYTVEYYYAVDGQYGAAADDSVTRSGTTDTEAAVTGKDKTTAREGYTFDSNAANVLSADIKGDGTTVLKVYFKEQFTVTYNPGTQGTFDAASTDSLDYNANTPAAPDAANEHNPGYTFAGWEPEVADKVTGNAEYTATWTANSNTPYRVEFYYESQGAYGTEASIVDESRTGTTAETVSVTDADKSPVREGYIFDSSASGNNLSATVNGDGTTTLKVYFKEQFTVTYKPGTQGTFADAVHAGLSYGSAAPEAPDTANNHRPGYTFTGWSPSVVSPVTGNATYIAQWKANEDTSYTVKFFYEKNGSYDSVPDKTDATRAATTGASVSVTDEDKTPSKKGYVFDANASVVSGQVAGDGSLVLEVRFKEQFTVTYKPGTKGTFQEETTGNLAYGTATPAAPDAAAAHKAGYTFAGWTPEVAETVTANAEYTATWTANTDTAYTVKFFYEKNGAYGDTPDSVDADRTGTTDETVSVTDDDKKPSETGYILDADASKLTGKVKGDGSLVLEVRFKEQFTVSYTAGDHGTFETQTTSGLDYNTKTPEFTGDKTGEAGYEFTGWTPVVAEKVTSNATYVAQWKAKSGIPYTVEYYYAKDGKYPDKATGSVQKSGITGETASVTDEDKTPSGEYAFDSKADNVLSATIKGNGTTTLKVYFKEQFTVTYKPGTQGTFADTTTGSLDYNAKTPAAPDAAGNHNPGYTFAGWEPEVADKVTGNAEYTATWTANEDTRYTVNYFGYDGNGGWTVLESKKLKGTTDTEVEASIKGYEGYSFYDGYQGNVLKGNVAGDGSLELSVYYRVKATVTITGHTDKQKYNGEEQSVEGYELSSTTSAMTGNDSGLMKASGIMYDTANVAENASISKVAKGKNVGTYDMGLTEDMFRNTEQGFDVTFVVASDGQMEITTRTVVLTSASATKEYDGKPLIKDEIIVSGDGFVEGEGFGYLFTGSQTKVGKSDNTFKYEITEEYQNTNPDNYEVAVEYGILEVTEAKVDPGKPDGPGPDRRITNQIKDGQGYSKTEIADGKTPHGNKMLDAECCILHLILMLAALAVAMGYTKDMKDRQAKIQEYEETLAKAGFKL